MHGNKVAKISAIFVAATMYLSKGDRLKKQRQCKTLEEISLKRAREGER